MRCLDNYCSYRSKPFYSILNPLQDCFAFREPSALAGDWSQNSCYQGLLKRNWWLVLEVTVHWAEIFNAFRLCYCFRNDYPRITLAILSKIGKNCWFLLPNRLHFCSQNLIQIAQNGYYLPFSAISDHSHWLFQACYPNFSHVASQQSSHSILLRLWPLSSNFS